MALIGQLVNKYRRQNSLDPICVEETSLLLDGYLGIDSLDLAVLVVELEEATGCDPFAQGIINFRTAGELAELYGGIRG
jgi:acyl carrier protein